MSLAKNLRPGGRNGVASHESRDPIGYAVAALNRLARSELLDRVGLRKHAEQTVFTVTQGCFRTATSAGRAFAQAGHHSRPGARAAATPNTGVFDLTPTDDEQMPVDVVTELAAEVLRPAAGDAHPPCSAPPPGPPGGLAASPESGLPLLGVPESLGGISEERAVMAGALVAEALAHGDLGLAVATLAPGAVATAIATWGTDRQQRTYLPAFTGDDVAAAALALTEPRPLFDAPHPAPTPPPPDHRPVLQ